MRTFRQIAESDDDMSSMPHDHLHAMTHGVLTAGGFSHVHTDTAHPHYTQHSYHARSTPEDDMQIDDEGDTYPTSKLDRLDDAHLAAHGWKSDPLSGAGLDSRSNDDVTHIVHWRHPNGSVLQARDHMDADYEIYNTTIHLRHPK